MTAPASLLAPLAAPAGRPATGDGASAAAGGFEALLSMLAGAQEGTAAGDGSTAAGAASGEAVDKASDDSARQESALAGWLAQTLGQSFAAPRPDGAWGQGDVQSGSASSASGQSIPGQAGAADQTWTLPGGGQPAQGPLDLAALQALRPGPLATPPVRGAADQTTAPPTPMDQTPADQTTAPPATDAVSADTSDPEARAGAATDQTVPPMIRTGGGAALAAAIPQKVSPQASQQASQATPVAVAAQAPPVVTAAPPSPAVAAEVAAAITAPDAAPIDAAPAPATLPPEPKAVAGRRSTPTAASGIAGPNAKAAAGPDPALSPVEVAEAASDETGHEAAPAEPALDGPEPATTRIDGQAQTLAGRADAVAGAPAPSTAHARVTPETVTRLAVGIIDKLGGQASRFDLQLDPLGLGKVDVSVEIGADGRLAARLNFDNAQAASELRGRAQDLRQALEQAGFSLGEGSLSFDFAGQNRDQKQASDDSRRADHAGRAFARAMGALEDEAVLPVRFQARRGLDLLI